MIKFLKTSLIVFVIAVFGLMLYVNTQMYLNLADVIIEVNNSFDIYKEYHKQILNKMLKFFEKNINNEVLDVDNLKEANVFIINKTAGCCGAGTVVKIKNKRYVLSCAHLFRNLDDKLYIITDEGEELELTLLKIDKKEDLSLLSCSTLKSSAYVNIANYIPRLGTSVRVIGNPDLLTDVITEGIISRYLDGGYLMTALCFGGNSGGAVIDNRTGELIGVLTNGYIMMNKQIFVAYSWAVDINTIKTFIQEYEK